jgi:hypothetical protein
MPTEDAVKAYEHGIAHGSLSALARQYRDGLVNLTVGNIRSKETVTVRLEILGDSRGVRAGRTIAAIFAFVAEGHTRSAGAFRLHVERLVRFLKSIGAESETERRVMEKALETASRGNVPPGQWLALANESGTRWKQIEAALNLIP